MTQSIVQVILRVSSLWPFLPVCKLITPLPHSSKSQTQGYNVHILLSIPLKVKETGTSDCFQYSQVVMDQVSLQPSSLIYKSFKVD